MVQASTSGHITRPDRDELSKVMGSGSLRDPASEVIMLDGRKPIVFPKVAAKGRYYIFARCALGSSVSLPSEVKKVVQAAGLDHKPNGTAVTESVYKPSVLLEMASPGLSL